MTYQEIIARLHELAQPDKVAYKEKKFGVVSQNALGVYMKDIKELAKEIPKDDDLALRLFDSNIYEARLLCSKLFSPKALTDELAEKWVVTFDNWEICDSFSMGIFARSPFALPLINKWASRTAEFEKRAAFATMAAYCMADKKAGNEVFLNFLPMIEAAADDERNFVKKAVNWALRGIGKRNIDLNQEAIACAKRILRQDNKAARWIASNALKELEKEGVRISDYPRNIYRKGEL
ncbi:MAG: DNA alkylation repair protein [Bacteroidota bacterium]